jgi:hypothetical protein
MQGLPAALLPSACHCSSVAGWLVIGCPAVHSPAVHSPAVHSPAVPHTSAGPPPAARCPPPAAQPLEGAAETWPPPLHQVLAHAGKGRVIATQFASNMHRMHSVKQAAEASGRKVRCRPAAAPHHPSPPFTPPPPHTTNSNRPPTCSLAAHPQPPACPTPPLPPHSQPPSLPPGPRRSASSAPRSTPTWTPLGVTAARPSTRASSSPPTRWAAEAPHSAAAAPLQLLLEAAGLLQAHHLAGRRTCCALPPLFN